MKKAIITKMPQLDYSGRESISGICSNLQFAGRDVRKIVMTSVSASDGKSYITMQIAANMGRRGKKVCVVDADMRRSFLIKKYGIETEDDEVVGLAHLLAGYNELKDVLYETNLPGVHLIPIGRDVSDPVPLLNSTYFSELLEELTLYFDLILIDAPPIGLVIDAAEIADCCDGCVIVIHYNKTHRRDLIEAQMQMEETSCRILGYVINKVTFDTLSAKQYYNKSYYNHYNSEYYHKSDKKKSAKKKS